MLLESVCLAEPDSSSVGSEEKEKGITCGPE